MRALQTFARRPLSLLGLGAALVASVPACACGVGLVLVPVVGGALLRVALDAAGEPHAPTSAETPATSRAGMVGLWLALPLLAAIAAGGLGAALETALGSSLVARAVSPFPAVAAVTALVVAAVLSGPFALSACASTSGARDALSALHAVHARRGLPLSRGVVVSCAALPLLITAPWAALFDGGSWALTAILAALSAMGAPLAVCALASAWTSAHASTEPTGTSADELPSSLPSRLDRGRVVALAVLVAAGCALVLAAFLTPARLTRVTRNDAPLGGPPRSFDTQFTVPGTTVRIARDGDGFGVSVADGGGAGRLPGVERARGFRVATRPELCRNCVELELQSEHGTTRTLLDAAGVRHDDGPAARLASAGGVIGNLALGLAVLGTLALAHGARRPRAVALAVVAAWCAAALAFAHGVLP